MAKAKINHNNINLIKFRLLTLGGNFMPVTTIDAAKSIPAVPVIIVCVLLGVLISLLISRYRTSSYHAKLLKAKLLIEDGHSKAVNGRVDDNIFQSVRKTRLARED